MGYEGGIACDITPEDKTETVIVVSITHLQIDSLHPMAEQILDYQQKRIKSLQH